MQSGTAERRLIAVVGATGVGKSEVALALAAALGGEVLGADAYQLYRGLDIGTAKLSPAARGCVPHHLIDIADPDEAFTLARYLDCAHEALAEVWGRGALPVLAGGSGQYVWALLEGWQVPRVAPDAALRAELEALAAAGGAATLRARLAEYDAEAAARLDPHNVRRLVRALEVVIHTGRPLAACQTRRPIDADVLILGLSLPREALHQRLDERVDVMFTAGLVEEVRRLRRAGYGDCRPLREAMGYREVSAYLDGGLALAEAIARTKAAHHRLVRRQQAWFKPDDPRIRWLPAGPGAAQEAIAAAKAWLAGAAARPSGEVPP